MDKPPISEEDQKEMKNALRIWELGAAEVFSKSLMAHPLIKGFSYQKNDIPEVVLYLEDAPVAIRVKFVADLVSANYKPEEQEGSE